jgi:hypothetical protein
VLGRLLALLTLAHLQLAALLALGCASPPPAGPERYRLSHSGTHWDVAGSDRILDDLAPRYPEFFELILDPARGGDPDLLELRDDLERKPVSRRNYDALNSIAIGYFEINSRGESQRDAPGMSFMGQGFRAAKLVAVPWRAYGEISDVRLRDGILDFFEDVASGEKLATQRTRGRITGIVASLEKKETDPARLRRIRTMVASLPQ